MREHRADRSKTTAPGPWRVPVAVEDIAETGQHFALVADEAVRAGIARMVGLRELPRLQADFDVTRQSAGGLRVTARVSATVGQTCVVSLEPLDNEIEEDIDLVFVPPVAGQAAEEAAADGEQRAEPRWDDLEPLIGGVVDLGALATEFLLLGIDPYPRKPGASFEAPQERGPEAGPFAALAGWSKGRDGH